MATDIRHPAIEIPPLRHGDRMTRAEFERRWNAMPDEIHAELIDGAVCMPPLSRSHGTPHFRFVTILGYYEIHTPGIEGADNTSIRFDDESMPQPDALLRILETHGGRSQVDDEGYYISGPELIVEIARSSSAHDLGAKRELYRRYGVPEYIVWRVEAGIVDWFVLNSGRYVLQSLPADGVLRSHSFPGLWIDTASLIQPNPATLLAVAQQGIGSPEHIAFVETLRQRAEHTTS